MNRQMILNLGLQEVEKNDLREISGGFGWYPGYNQDAAVAGKSFWNLVDEFKAGFMEGYNKARQGK